MAAVAGLPSGGASNDLVPWKHCGSQVRRKEVPERRFKEFGSQRSGSDEPPINANDREYEACNKESLDRIGDMAFIRRCPGGRTTERGAEEIQVAQSELASGQQRL
jgi:hypothetical protein